MSSEEDIQIRKETLKCFVQFYSTFKHEDVISVQTNDTSNLDNSLNLNFSVYENNKKYSEKVDLDEFCNRILENAVQEVLNDSDYLSKNLISSNEVLDLKLDLVNCLLENYQAIQKFNIGVQIKKFFYTNLFFANKITLTSTIIYFSLEKFKLLSKLIDSPYSPSKQKKLYQIQFKYQSKDNKFPDMELPVNNKSIINLEEAPLLTSTSVNQTRNFKESKIDKNSNTTGGFSFSSDWINELYKVLIESVFARKIDEEDNQNYNIKLINAFFNNLSSIIEKVDEKSIESLLQKIDKKLEENQLFSILIFHLEQLTSVLIENKKNLNGLYKLLTEKKTWILNSIYREENEEEEDICKNKNINLINELDENILTNYSPNSTKTKLISSNYSKVVNFQKRNSISSFNNRIDSEYRLVAPFKANPQDLNWRLVKSFYNSLSLLLPSFSDDIATLSSIIDEAFDKIEKKNNYQIQISLINVIVEIFKSCNSQLRVEIINKVISNLFKNKNFYIRRLVFDFSEKFIIKYSFKLFKELHLYAQIIKMFRDFTFATNLIEFLWRVYPFIENDMEMKNEFKLQLQILKNCASYDNKSNISGNVVLDNNIIKKSNNGNEYCSKSRSKSILTAIEEFQIKTKKLYSLVNVDSFVQSDNDKYNSVIESLNKNESKVVKELIILRDKPLMSSTNSSKKDIQHILHSQEIKKSSIKSVKNLDAKAVIKKPISSQDLVAKLKPINDQKVSTKSIHAHNKNQSTMDHLPKIKTKGSSFKNSSNL